MQVSYLEKRVLKAPFFVIINTMKNILVLGGAGYIGSACVKALCDQGYFVSVVDNLSQGDRKFVDSRAQFMERDILHKGVIDRHYDLIFHFAAHKNVAESMQNAPRYAENISGMINVLDAMVEYEIPRIIFSSSAGVYGEAEYLPIDEKHQTKPINFYGFTKLKCEELMEWYRRIHGINYVSLRYFNAVGDTGLRYIEKDARNLFPIIQEVLRGEREMLEIYGDDYDTRDGTCIRDYIHLTDLIAGHLAAMSIGGSDIFNLGSAEGYTVMEIVQEFEKQTGKKIPRKIGAARKCDPKALIAGFQKAEKLLKWKPEKTLAQMVSSVLHD